jgi:hypothetical protein
LADGLKNLLQLGAGVVCEGVVLERQGSALLLGFIEELGEELMPRWLLKIVFNRAS